MNIAINTRLLIKDKLEGIGWFTYETLKRICKAHPEHTFFFLFDRMYDKSFLFSNNVKPIVVKPQARHPFLFYLWFELAIPRILKKIKADIFISPDGYLSLKTKVKSLTVIHDINFEHFPNDVPFLARKHYRYYFPRYAKKADRIVTVSHFSKKDIIEKYHIHTNKIDVVYNGANEQYKPISNIFKNKIRSELCDGKPYFIFVGAIHPRKNVKTLLLAFDMFKKQDKENYKLVIVGEKMWKNYDVEKVFEQMQSKNDVIFTGRLESDKLHKYVAAAKALLLVSIFEGFGIPIVEAFYCNTAVITSNITAMPEVAGDAALLVDPYSKEDISNAMTKLTNDENLRNKLIEKGKIRRQLFSWDKTAENLWKSIEKVMNQALINTNIK